MESSQGTILVPAMVFAEILYLSEKRRIPTTLADVSSYLNRNPSCQEYPMSLAIIQAAALIDDIRELHDRLIAGTAQFFQRVLITNDPIIQASRWVQTLW